MNFDDSEKSNIRDISIGHRNWLLTFGDLLTLLLCFFLAIISFSPINPSPERKEYAEKSGYYVDKTQSQTNAGRSSTNGTTLAHVEGKEGGKELRHPVEEYWFAEEDFGSLLTDISAKRAEEFKKSVTSVNYAPKKIEIETCNILNPPGDEINKAVIGLRALALRRQVIDAMPGSTAEDLRLMEFADSCSRFAKNQEQPKVAMVRIFWNSKNG